MKGALIVVLILLVVGGILGGTVVSSLPTGHRKE